MLIPESDFLPDLQLTNVKEIELQKTQSTTVVTKEKKS